MTMPLRRQSVAFVVPHERGCVDTVTGDVHDSMEAAKATADTVVFNILGPTTPGDHDG